MFFKQTGVQRSGKLVSDVLFSVGGAIFLAAFAHVMHVQAINAGSKQPAEYAEIDWPTVLTGAFPGLMLGLLISFIRTSGKRLRADISSVREELEESAKQLENTIHELDKRGVVDLVEKATACLEFYGPLKDILSTHRNQTQFARLLIGNAMQHYRSIPHAEPARFYEMLIDGIRLSAKWEGIHQGKLELLGRDLPQREAGPLYAKVLLDACRDRSITARRVIILSETEMSDLQERSIMLPFWEKTGQHVPSYWILKEDVLQMLGVQESELMLDDCALYDRTILLHYARREKVITIAFSEKDNPIATMLERIFRELEDWCHDKGNYQFHVIDKAAIEALSA